MRPAIDEGRKRFSLPRLALGDPCQVVGMLRHPNERARAEALAEYEVTTGREYFGLAESFDVGYVGIDGATQGSRLAYEKGEG